MECWRDPEFVTGAYTHCNFGFNPTNDRFVWEHGMSSIGAVVRTGVRKWGVGLVVEERGESFWVCCVHGGVLQLAKSHVRILYPPPESWLGNGKKVEVLRFYESFAFPNGTTFIYFSKWGEVRTQLPQIVTYVPRSKFKDVRASLLEYRSEGLVQLTPAGHEVAVIRKHTIDGGGEPLKFVGLFNRKSGK
jgi:hypothetical protein